MKKTDETRAQFEERYLVPSGAHWDPKAGPAGNHSFSCNGYCSGDRLARYIARWEAWQSSRETLRVKNPFPAQMGDPDAFWAREVAENSLRGQGLKVVG